MNLLSQHHDLIRQVARKLRARLPRFVQLDELISDGAFGLLDAARTFDPERHVSFVTFARPRIRGAMIDGLRQRNAFRRRDRAGARPVVRTCSLAALPDEQMLDRRRIALLDVVAHHDARVCLARLGRRDRLVLTLYFLEGLSMRDTGAVLGRTEARASMLIKRAPARARGDPIQDEHGKFAT